MLLSNPTETEKDRCRRDFEYWCGRCVTIRHKTLGKDVPFVLNAPQKKVARMLEEDRLAGRPIRLIMLKAPVGRFNPGAGIYGMDSVVSVSQLELHNLFAG